MLKLCVAGAVLMLSRTPLLPVFAKLGDLFHNQVPDLPTSDMYGQVSWAAGIAPQRRWRCGRR